MTTINSLILPTTYTTFESLMGNWANTYSPTGMPLFTNAAATAEYTAFHNYYSGNAKTVSQMNDPAFTDSTFAGFLTSESHWWSGSFRIPGTPVIVNKWLGYAGGAAALYFLVLK